MASGVITGITRVRNEALIFEDTLRHYLEVCDRVIVYDDASTDETADIAASFDRVELVRGPHWRANRPDEETRHRALLLRRVSTPWTLCFDADERLVGPMPDLSVDGYRFRLYDGYMVEGSEPYVDGPLAELNRMWGPEYRDILMLFRTERARYRGKDKREPTPFHGRVQLARTRVKHFGKCLSVEHWEDTCDYYANHWPEPYRSKWAKRRGKALHTRSDFGRGLYPWNQLERHGVKL